MEKEIGWYKESANHFLCNDCFQEENINKSEYIPIKDDDLKENIYTCDKCGKEVGENNNITKRQKEAQGKKQSANWKIAIIHYLISAIAIFLLVLTIGFFISLIPISMFLLGAKSSASAFTSSYLSFLEKSNVLLTIIAIFINWFSTKYSAQYLNKHFIIKDAEKIAGIATIYMFVFYGSYFIIKGLPEFIKPTAILAGLLNIFLFYIFSQKYIKNTEKKKTA